MKVLTAAQMREVDRRTIELGIPGLILMENAGHRVVEFMQEAFAPLASKRVVVLCGKGNNGGDGLVVARQLYTRVRPRSLHVLLAASPEELKGDAAANYQMLRASGCSVESRILPEMRSADIVVDALLGTGLKGAASGLMLDLIREINTGFPNAKVVAVDIPSGLMSDTGYTEGESVRADYTVTFTAPKVGQVLGPSCDRVGELRVAAIGSPEDLYEGDPEIYLSVVEPKWFAPLFASRPLNSHKGNFGHVLVVAGSRGKTGAAAMAGLAALRSGAGLVTVATADPALDTVARFAPELMTAPLPSTETGAIAKTALPALRELARGKDALAIGPGLGTHPQTVEVVCALMAEIPQPMVVDADALNALASTGWTPAGPRIFTPHPGEMSRLTAQPTSDILRNGPEIAQRFAMDRRVTLVLKGHRTLIAFPDGRVWVNTTGSPAMATGGTGDILTGLVAGLLGQHPEQPDLATGAAVWLHGMAGQIGARTLGEQALIATDLLRFLPEAIRACTSV